MTEAQLMLPFKLRKLLFFGVKLCHYFSTLLEEVTTMKLIS